MGQTNPGGGLLSLRQGQRVRALDAFLRSPAFVVFISILTALCNLLALELFLYTVIIGLSVWVCLFGSDLLAMMPMVILCYVAPSPANNPGHAANKDSIFLMGNGGGYLFALLVIFSLALLFRLATDPDFGGRKFLRTPRRLINGMLILCGAYLLSGLGIERYRELFQRNLVFSLLQGASIVALYFLFTGSVKWETVPKEYFAWVGMCLGLVVVPQLMENYLSRRIFMPGTGTMDRELIYTGWGMHNNMGGLMAMMIPFPFYLACCRKHGWFYNGIATGLMVSVVLSCSRTSIVVGAVVYCICAVILLVKRKDQRIWNLLLYLLALGVGIGFAIVFYDRLRNIFDLFVEELFLISQRDNLFYYGNKQFIAHPLFGGSFFPQGKYVPWDWSTSKAFSAFFPPRWHNTIVQLGASCGLVGLLAYAIHRFETVGLLLKERSLEKWFIALYVFSLLSCSLMDCHFFNVGPVLFYSMALAFAEKIGLSKVDISKNSGKNEKKLLQ